MEFVLQIVTHLAVLIGGGGVVKLYEIYRSPTQGKTLEEYTREQYESIISAKDAQYEKAQAQHAAREKEYEDTINSLKEKYDQVKADAKQAIAELRKQQRAIQ